MTIISKTIGTAGQVGVTPRRIQFVVTDSLSVVTTANYLQPDHLYPDTIQPTDIVDMYYGATNLNAPGTYGEFLVSITAGVITLVQAEGSVALPTIVNHIAVYNSTSGGLGEDAATAINGGNIQAGLSGTAGTLASFPATASKGSLVVKAVANTGNTLTTISNAAMGQASVISIPDPAGATADFVLAPAALVSGNLVQASGTVGLVADSGVTAASVSGAITQLGQLQQISMTLTPAQIIASYATPVVLIAAVAGKMAIVHSANVYTASTGNTAFATGVAPIIQYGVTAHGAGTIAVGTGLVTGDITAATSQVRTIGAAASAVYTGTSNSAIAFSCTTAYTGGAGTNVTFTLVYELITATV